MFKKNVLCFILYLNYVQQFNIENDEKIVLFIILTY